MGAAQGRRLWLMPAVVVLVTAGAIWIVSGELHAGRTFDRAHAQCRAAGLTETSIDNLFEAMCATDGSRDKLLEKFTQVYIGEPPAPAYVACITALVDASIEQRQ